MLTRRNLRIKVMQHLFAFHVQSDAGEEYPDQRLQASAERLVKETESIYHHFVNVLALIPAFVALARTDSKTNHRNLLQNAWVIALIESQALEEHYTRGGRTWDKHGDRVRDWFKTVIKTGDIYTEYRDLPEAEPAAQKKFVLAFIRKMILGKTIINEFFEEKVLMWAEDKTVIRGLAEKTIKSFEPAAGTPITLPALSLEWKDDCEFVERLFSAAARLAPEHRDLIAAHTRNWEVERLPLTDRVILEMAISEMINFPNIPVKVTINEYIDLAKQYSVPKSWQFVNGILDVLSRILVESGAVRKSGRGLIDNK